MQVKQSELAPPAEAQPRRSPIAFRGGASIGLAVLVCLVVWMLLPRDLHIRTPIVGYPIFAAFDYHRYFDAFYLIAIGIPVLSICFYALMVLVDRRRHDGVWFRGSGRSATHSASVLNGPNPQTSTELRPQEGTLRWLGGAALRLALPGFLVAIEVGSSNVRSSTLHAGALGPGVLYVAVVMILAALLGRLARIGFRRGLEIVNSVAALTPLAFLWFVSRGSSVLINSTGKVVHYAWLPAGVAVGLTGCCLAAVVVCLIRGIPSRKVEIAVVGILNGSLLVFLSTAALPGALGYFSGFDDGQFLAGAQLNFWHGLLPWRDQYLLHGLIEDDLDGVLGFVVFSHSRWGGYAGLFMFVQPLCFVVDYLCVVYLARRKWSVISITAILLVVGQFFAIPRFVFLPVLVVVFEQSLRSRNRLWPVALGCLLVVESILTPEIALMAVCSVIVLGLEGWWGNRELPMSRRFRRLEWTLIGGTVTVLPFFAYLLITRSFGAFVDYFLIFGSDHALWGAQPFQWSLIHQLGTTIEFGLPILLWLATVARLVRRLVGRRKFVPRDWTFLLSGLFVVSYYQKVLDRLDTGHVYEIFVVSTPLVLLWGIELSGYLDAALMSLYRRVTTHLSASHGRLRVPHWARLLQGGALLSVAGILGLTVTVFADPVIASTLTHVPGRDHASSPVPAPAGLLGYTLPGSVNEGEIDGLGRILDTYAPTGPVFDFTNELGITYFLLNRVPGTRFTHVEEAQTPKAQQMLIAELGASRPRLVVFTDYDFGLPIVDFITGPLRNYLVSRYILTRYQPLAEFDGQLVMIRSDLVHRVPRIGSLHLAGVVGPSPSLYFQTFACAMGDIPDFLSAPAPGGKTLTVTPTSGRPINTVITGWAVDDKELAPATEVVATVDGSIVAETRPGILRPDIEKYFATSAVADSGFEIQVNVARAARIQLFALNRDGTVSRIQPAPTAQLPRSLAIGRGTTTIRSSGGATYRVVRGRLLSGWVNTYARVANEWTYQIVIPKTVHLDEYGWAQVSVAPAGGQTSVTISDGSPQASHSISFTALPGVAPLRLPVGSCPQWYGYRRNLTIVEQGDRTPALRLTLYP